MSNKVRFELNKAGVKDLLNSDKMRNVMRTFASERQSMAGEGYAIRETHTDRVGYTLYPATPHAKNSNLKYNTLEKVIR